MALEMIDLMRRDDFWQDGCGRMSANVCELLRLAGEQVTLQTVSMVVETLPRNPGQLMSYTWRQESYFAKCLKKACEKDEDEARQERIHALARLFSGILSPALQPRTGDDDRLLRGHTQNFEIGCGPTGRKVKNQRPPQRTRRRGGHERLKAAGGGTGAEHQRDEVGHDR
jgi:hypothetical protein